LQKKVEISAWGLERARIQAAPLYRLPRLYGTAEEVAEKPRNRRLEPESELVKKQLSDLSQTEEALAVES
jgi:hypothetical protein